MELVTKKNIFLVRLMVIIILAYLTIFGDLKHGRMAYSYLFIAFYLLTNLAIPYIPEKFFINKKAFYFLVFFDSGMISLGIYFSGRAGTDFYLVYFLIIGLAAMSTSLKYLMINTTVFTLLYGWILYQNRLFSGDLAISYALRLPFMIIIALFFGYIVETIIKDKDKNLRESEEKYRQLFSRESDAIVVFDAGMAMVKDVNDAALNLYGYGRAEFLKLKATDIFANSKKGYDDTKEIVAGDTKEIQLQYHKKRDGTIFPAEVSAGAFTFQNRPMISTVIRDITTRLRAEEAVRSSEQKFRESEEKLDSIVKAVPDIIYRLDNEGRITFINETIKKYGYSIKSLIGKKLSELVHPHDIEKAKYRINERRTGDRSTKGLEIRLVKADFDGSPVESGFIGSEDCGVFLIDSAGIYRSERPVSRNFLGTQGIAKDISDYKRLEAQFVQAQKMESIGTVASGIAHNFRNILASIALNSQLMQMKYDDHKPIKEIAEKFNRAVEKGARLVEGLLQFSRKNGAREFDVLDLAQLIQETYDIITESFDKKIDITIDLPESLPIMGDHSGLSQVLMNLCANARDAMPEGGELHILAGNDGDRALVIIADTGKGMDRETERKCFDPFFTTKDVGKGTGLGLSTAYGIVKDHGGMINVYSELNKGTTFKLYFPIALPGKKGKRESQPEIVRGKGEKILVVDDETDSLQLMQDLLEGLGYRAASAGSGKEAIIKYKSWQPDAVLLDRNMPGMDGMMCAEEIIKHDPGARIIIFSGYDENGPNGISEQSKQLIKDYLTKPIETVELSRVLAQVLR